MSSSLLIAGFDVLDPTSPVQLVTGFDRGAPVPSVAEIQSTVLDGAVVSGFASGNRQPAFTLLVRGTSRAGLAATANQVLQYVDQQSWTMQFTPDGGFPLIYDCFRATASISSSLADDAQLKQQIDIKCEALPYGRSSQPQSLTLIASAPSVVDDMTTTPTVSPSSPWSSALSVTTSFPFHGTQSLLISPSAVSQTYVPRLTLSRSGLSVSAPNGVSYMTVGVYGPDFGDCAGATAGSYAPATWTLSVTVSGTVYTATSNQQPSASTLSWLSLRFAFATAVPAGTVTAYSLTLTAWNVTATSKQMAVDYLVAYPSSGTLGTSAWGNEYVLPGIVGSARAPVNLQVTPTSGTFGQMCVHAPPSDTPLSQCLLTINLPASSSSTFADTQPGVRYAGTYSVWVSYKPATALTTGTTLTCNVGENGVSGLVGSQSLVTLSHVVTADEHSMGATHMLLYFGEVQLPLTETPQLTFPSIRFFPSTVGLSSTDVIGDVLVLDTRGQTILSDIHTPSVANLWVNEPDPGAGMGQVFVSTTGVATNAFSLAGNLLTGAPVWVSPPGNSRLLIWTNSSSAAPTNVLTYFPRWLQEATS